MPSDHSRQNKDLLARNAMLQIEALVETATDGILLADEQAKTTAWNTNFLTIWKLPPDQVGVLLHQGAQPS